MVVRTQTYIATAIPTSTMKESDFEGCKFTPLPFKEEKREVKKKKREIIKLVLAIAGLALIAGCVTLVSQRRGESLSLSLPNIAQSCKSINL